MLLQGVTNVLKPTSKRIWLKMKPTEKVINIVSQLLTYYKQGINNFGQVTNISQNIRFALFFKSILLGGIIKVLKSINKSI